MEHCLLVQYIQLIQPYYSSTHITSLLTPTTVAEVQRLAASVILCICLSVCPHDNTETVEIKIAKLGTGIVHRESSPIN